MSLRLIVDKRGNNADHSRGVDDILKCTSQRKWFSPSARSKRAVKPLKLYLRHWLEPPFSGSADVSNQVEGYPLWRNFAACLSNDFNNVATPSSIQPFV